MEKRTKIILYFFLLAGAIAISASFYRNIVVEDISVLLVKGATPVPIATVSAEIQACEWSPVYFFFFSENVFDQVVYYSHFIPALLSLIFGLYVFRKSRNNPLTRALLIIVSLFFIWSMADMIVWATDQPQYVMFFWAITNLIDPLIYFVCLYFTYLFLNKKPLSFQSAMIAGVLLLPTFILLPTHFNLESFDLTNCDRNAVEGALVFANYYIETIFMGWALVLVLKKYFNSKEQAQKSEALTVLCGLIFFLISFALGNVVGSYTGNWSYGQYGLFGMPFFIGFLVYNIVRYKKFIQQMNAKSTILMVILIVSVLVSISIFFTYKRSFVDRSFAIVEGEISGENQ
ncbi:MAG: histidine kinase N-terminal 7TM domain-containing protein [Patescibacteria group bacterium]|jgi:hypothetical protein